VCRALQLPPEAWLCFWGNICCVMEIIVSDDGRAGQIVSKSLALDEQ
jgi:hypothetical protein